jgi:hypothetical protein
METPEIIKPVTTRDIILRNGLIGGAASIAIIVIYYVVSTDILLNPMWASLPLLLVLAAGVMASISRKKNQGGYITYGESVFTGLGAFGIGVAVMSIFNLVLYHLIDPSLTVKIKNMTLDRLDESLKSGKIDKDVYRMQADFISNPSVWYIAIQLFFQLLFLVFVGFIVYLVASIFIKNDSPFKKNPL